MTDKEPTVHFYLEGTMPADDFQNLVVALGKRMLGEEVKFGQTELDLHNMERDALTHTVSVDAARDFYQRYYRARKPSSIAATVMSEIASTLSEEQKVLDKRGRLRHITRTGWDESFTQIARGESSLSYKPGSEKRRFLEAFNMYLPEIESEDKKRET